MMTNPFGPGPFQPNPFGAGASGPHRVQQPSPGPPRDEANVLATLSVVFAFVFAPAGLILGHLGLAQIRRTGQRGRDRALIGVTLSYVFITAMVVALIVGAVMPDTNSTQAASQTTATPKLSPAPLTVAPANMDGLLPTLDDVKNFTGDAAVTVDSTHHQISADPNRKVIDRPDCWSVFEFGAPESYDVAVVTGYSDSDFGDTHDLYNQWSLGGGVSSFRDATAAQTQLSKLLSILRKCGGSTANKTYPGGQTFPISMQPPTDAGNGITTMETVAETPPRIYGVRAIAAKDNVFIDVGVWTTISSDRGRQAALAIANFILNKLPG
ncbi:MAG TPA: sensor domain-containing protein [Mycobacterium sp.]|nr:sensor domain-containing protein [Mycobacterium sp.]